MKKPENCERVKIKIRKPKGKHYMLILLIKAYLHLASHFYRLNIVLKFNIPYWSPASIATKDAYSISFFRQSYKKYQLTQLTSHTCYNKISLDASDKCEADRKIGNRIPHSLFIYSNLLLQYLFTSSAPR